MIEFLVLSVFSSLMNLVQPSVSILLRQSCLMGVLLLLHHLCHQVTTCLHSLLLLSLFVKVRPIRDLASIFHELLEHDDLVLVGLEGLPLVLLFLVGTSHEVGFFPELGQFSAHFFEFFVFEADLFLQLLDHFFEVSLPLLLLFLLRFFVTGGLLLGLFLGFGLVGLIITTLPSSPLFLLLLIQLHAHPLILVVARELRLLLFFALCCFDAHACSRRLLELIVLENLSVLCAQEQRHLFHVSTLRRIFLLFECV